MSHGGRGWIDYDHLFCQQAELNSSLWWNVIHPELQATMVLCQWIPEAGLFCSVSQKCDHMAHQYALAQLQQPLTRYTPTSSHLASHNHARICTSWNNGACIYPGSCNLWYVWSVCFQHSHRARFCRNSVMLRQRAPQSRSAPHPFQSPQVPILTW